MTRGIGFARILMVALIAAQATPRSAAQTSPAGHWVGQVSYQGDALPVELTFETAASGLTGFFSAPTLRAYRYPVRNASFDGSGLAFDLIGDGATFPFKGMLVEPNSLTGRWNLFGVDATVSLTRGVAPSTPYRTEPVTCRNGDVFLQGAVFVPTGSGAHPAVVFVHGSGSETRDASNFLADRLAREGVASLTFDKRGAGASTGDWRQANFNDLAKDVLACVQMLKARPDIIGSKIGLVGASQAGWIAPLVASLSRDVAFIALISGPAVPVWREGWWDTEFRLREGGFDSDEIERAREILRLNDEVTRTGRGIDDLENSLQRARTAPWFEALGLASAPPADAPFRRFYRGILDFDPLPLLQRIAVPSLWLFGDRDDEMPSMESAAILERLRAEGKDFTIRIFPRADHALFASPEPGQAFRWPRVVPGYVDTLTEWIKIKVNE